MVTFRPAGRLGNWLFEFAAAWSFAEKYGLEFFQPISDYDNLFSQFGKIGLDQFFRPVEFYRQMHHGYTPIMTNIMSDVVLEGFFQSYKYFDEYKEQIQHLFNPNWKIILNTCAVHVRRGDYLSYPTKHPVIGEEYLNKAIDFIKKMHGDTLFVFFSDDFSWAKDYMQKTGLIALLSENKIPIDDLRLMSCCSHQIISNSSFSWWGAYLNKYTYKTVVAPHEDNWFGPDNKHLDVYDLLPPSWHRIKF